MTWLQFFSSIAASLSWPLAATVIALILRSSITSRISSLLKLKYKDLELEFDQLKAASAAVPEPPTESLGESPAERVVYTSLEAQVEDIAQKSPAAAVLIAWAVVETALSGAVARLAISPDSPSSRSPRHNLDRLVEEGHVDKIFANAVRQLNSLRNNIAHDAGASSRISVVEALEYGESAAKVARILQGLKRN